MGREVVKATAANAAHQLVGGCAAAGHHSIGIDLGTLAGVAPLGLVASDNLAAVFSEAEVMIDFSSPPLTLSLAALAAASGKILVTGTTGFTPAQQKELEQHAASAVIVQSFNMSMGVNLLASLVEKVSAALKTDFDIEILEMHHRQKVDAPSGTALMLGEAAAKGRKTKLAEVARYERSGITGARPAGEIGFAALRGGDVVGDHQVIFAGMGERITLSHQSSNRGIYATGALRAAEWAKGKAFGLYSMRDVLGL